MSKDKKKSKAVEPVELSKKERKALKAKEEALAAELERREAEKAAKKKAKKKAGKKSKGDDVAPVIDVPTEKKKSTGAKEKIAAAAEEALATPSSKGARIAAETAKAAADEALPSETDEEIKARVKAKRSRRKELADLADSIDRDDEAAVKAFNDELATLGGGEFITSNAEKAKNDARFDNDTEAVERAIEAVNKAAKAVAAVTATQVTEAVETETGTVFAVGTSDEPDADESGSIPVTYDLANPSEAPRTDFETNGLGQYKIKRPSDGKLVGYTRTTTYIDNLEDKSALTKWKLRLLLEGVALNDTEPNEREARTSTDPVAATVADLIHRRDVKIAKAHKADRKGKLGLGELDAITTAAWSEFKKALDKLADDLLEVGGVHEKALKGTNLHDLTEVHDLEGMAAIERKRAEDEITPSEVADVIEWADALKRAGVEVLPEYVEVVIVNHARKVAGRLDRIVKWKAPELTLRRWVPERKATAAELAADPAKKVIPAHSEEFVRPADQRARLYVLDLKSGRLDFGAGKIAQQLSMYATSDRYDLNTHETTKFPSNLAKDLALVVHLPTGSAHAEIHPINLTTGAKGNDLSAEVRTWRNEGKKALDLKLDLAASEASAE